MRHWQRANRDRVCGLCDGRIAKGEPLQVVTIVAITDPKVRCVKCAGPAPPDLPELNGPASGAREDVLGKSGRSTGARSFVKVGAIVQDYKQAQAGRESGEEG